MQMTFSFFVYILQVQGIYRHNRKLDLQLVVQWYSNNLFLLFFAEKWKTEDPESELTNCLRNLFTTSSLIFNVQCSLFVSNVINVHPLGDTVLSLQSDRNVANFFTTLLLNWWFLSFCRPVSQVFFAQLLVTVFKQNERKQRKETQN